MGIPKNKYEKGDPIQCAIPGVPNAVLCEAVNDLAKSRIEMVRNMLYHANDKLDSNLYSESIKDVNNAIEELQSAKIKIEAANILDAFPRQEKL